ncbi:hypothetical protein chiPu_0024590, partial [Chiloscyllium punctatum]|nr:hypothetical protein [Chiloscyllium punctatum]
RCEEGASLFDLLPQSQRTEVNDLLNASTHTAEFEQSAGQLNVDLDDLVVLDDRGRQILLAFVNSGIVDLNYTESIQQGEGARRCAGRGPMLSFGPQYRVSWLQASPCSARVYVSPDRLINRL